MRDFNKEKQFFKANSRHPNMGLNNKLCKHPQYWCRLHEVWLSTADVAIRHCKSKLTSDMIETRQCSCLEKRDYKSFVSNMQSKK